MATGAKGVSYWIHHHLSTGELSINSAAKAIEALLQDVVAPSC
jgi:hypothetical protein